MWANKYVGIPFKANGRDNKGLDCWGLARLIYKNEFNIQLPSLAEDYELNDDERIQELISQYKEGWSYTEQPSGGEIILFRLLGNEQHVGVAIDSLHFIHVRENSDTVVEKLGNLKWSKRIVGYFRYTPEKTSISLNAVPHPLKTQRITLPVPDGTTIKQVYDWLQKEYTSAPQLVDSVNILLNGRVIPKALWETTKVKDNDTLEYRAVAGKSAARLILTLAVMYAMYVTGTYFMGEGALFSGTSMAAKFGNFAVAAVASAAVGQVGMRLVDMIAPIRPPEDPGDTRPQFLFNGGSNQANRYGAIPVILGKVRMTPPLGANSFVDYEKTSTSYLNMMLVWGYGPLHFYEDTFRIGNKPMTSFQEVTMQTIYGTDNQPQADFDKFNKLYPEDLEQVYIGTELTWQGTPNPRSVGAEGQELADPITGFYNEDDVSGDKQPQYKTVDSYTVTETIIPPGVNVIDINNLGIDNTNYIDEIWVNYEWDASP